MKRIYSIVLMATALFIGTNAWADASVSTWADLKTELQKGGTVTLSADIEASALEKADCIWIGSETEDGDAPAAILDLDGHNITIKPNVPAINPFVISKGSLKVTSATPATITVTKGNKKIYKGTNVFSVFGASASQKQDPKTNPFSHLEIDANVTVQTQNGTVIAIDQLTSTHASIASLSKKPGYTTGVYAYGACVDVKGTLFSQNPDDGVDEKKCYGIKANGNLGTPVDVNDRQYAPYIHIHPSAVIMTDMTFAKSAAVYASGYAQWLIEGNCSGATGVYATTGSVTIHNAVVKSGAGTYVAPTAGGGANGAGSAIVINSRSGAYDGEVNVTVSGDTKAEATSGYAMEEIVNTKDNQTNVDSITISGGTFVGNQDKGALIVTETTAGSTSTTITVAGGNVTGKTGVIGTDSLATYLNKQSDTHATLVTDEKGNTTLVISEGDAPTGVSDFNSNAALQVKWTGVSKDIEGTFALKELEINEASTQTLTIKPNATFTVERVILGAKAQIIVEPGAKFIVTGKQGIVAPSVDNIILKTSESAQAIFLFNPSVSSNRHPNATVEFTSKSYRKDGKNVYQRFGIPSYTNDVQLEYKDPSSSVKTFIQMWDYAADAWTESWIPVPAATGVNVGVSGPFGCFDLASNNAKESPMTYLFKGALVGNNDASMTFNNKFNPYANSYMAPIDIKTLVDRLADNYPELSAAVYVYVALANDNYTWLPLAQSNFTVWDTPEVTEIAPMQAYMLYMIPGNTSNATVSYKDNVYDPYISGGSSAPARDAKATKKNFMKLTIANEEGIVFDRARILEDNQFSDEFDNGYDINKYMNEKVSLYVTTEEEAWSTLATDNAFNTYIGVNVAESGVYTISVAHNGLGYALVDLENNQVISLENGNSYSFYQEAGKNDTRFQVVKINKVPTAIDNVQNNVLSTKVMKDGVLYILKNGALYNAQGQIVK